MKKIKIFFFILVICFSKISYSAEKSEVFDGKGGREDESFLNKKDSNFKKGNNALKQSFKLKKKNKIKKANKRLEKALSYFISANKETPGNVKILNQLGYSFYLVGDLIMSEIYYQEALDIDPKNILINQRLGELYINTNRVDLAEERLKILANCSCQEYTKLKEIILSKKN